MRARLCTLDCAPAHANLSGSFTRAFLHSRSVSGLRCLIVVPRTYMYFYEKIWFLQADGGKKKRVSD